MSLQEHLILMCIIAEASNPFQKIHWHILEPQSFGDARRRDPRKELPTDRSALKAFPHCKRWLLLVSRARTFSMVHGASPSPRTTDVSLRTPIPNKKEHRHRRPRSLKFKLEEMPKYHPVLRKEYYHYSHYSLQVSTAEV
jgi:hypothetical protein